MGELRIRVSADGRLCTSATQGTEQSPVEPGAYHLSVGPSGAYMLARHHDDPRARSSVLMAGTLVHRMSVIEILNLVTSAHWTGELQVAGPTVTRTLGIAQGALKHARTSAESERLGELLVGAGRLPRARLAELLARQRPDERFGQLLVREGLLDEEQLFKQLQQQAEAIFYGAMLVERGSYWFVVPPESAPVPLTTFHLPIQGLLMEGMQRFDEMALYRERIPHNRLYPHAVPSGRRESLDEDALSLLALCDGSRSIDDLARLRGTGEFATVKAVYVLMRGGQLALRHGPAVDAALAKRLVRQFNEIARDVFVAFATYGGMERASGALTSWLSASRHALILGDRVEIDGTLDASAIIARLAEHPGEDPMQALHQALHELAAYALFLAANSVPLHEERALSRHVEHRLSKLTL